MLVSLVLPDLAADLESAPGLFSWRAIDRGTQLLLRYAPPPPTHGHVLDLGCGYGPITVAAALRAPEATLWAVDTDDLALEVTDRNARNLGCDNVRVATPRQVPADLSFDAIYSNPPIRIGKPALRRMLSGWLDRLQPDGGAHLVIKQSQGADGVAVWLADAGYDVGRSAAKDGYRILTVGRI